MEAAAVAPICQSHLVGDGAHNIRVQTDGVPIAHSNKTPHKTGEPDEPSQPWLYK